MFREEYYLIVGRKFLGYFVGWGLSASKGDRSSVEFDPEKVEQWDDDPDFDVIGFWHSHPFGAGNMPSGTDMHTMKGWIVSLGRPLLCAITHDDITMGWLFNEKYSHDYQVVPVRKIGRLFFGKLNY